MKKQFFLLGKNASKYSFSPSFFGKKFEQLGLSEHDYFSMDLERLDLLPDELHKIEHLIGFNVTIPYKTDIIPYLDKLDPAAAEIGAINTVKKLSNGQLIGYNTDYFGFWNALQPHLKPFHKDSQALILGTGGASKAVMYALKKNRIPYTLVSRNSSEKNLTYNQLTESIIQNHLLIINTTPLGTFPNISSRPDLPYHLLSEQHLGYDLVYNPAQTAFMNGFIQTQGKALNGYEMLVGQAEKSWEIWTS